MDWLQFIAAVIGHLAWPSVIIVLLVLLRHHIGALADRLEEFSFGGAKFIWRKKLEEGAQIIEQAPPVKQIEGRPELKFERSGSPSDRERERIAKSYRDRRRERDDWIRKSGLSSIIFDMAEVDDLLFQIGDKLGLDVADAASVVYSLGASKVIPDPIVNLYETLRDARTAIAHSPTLPSDSEAAEYRRQIDYLRSVLSSLLDNLPTGDTGKK